MNAAALAFLAFAFIPAPVVSTAGPSASPSPESSAAPLRTIATVKASPYCSSLVTHFNGALRPMVANDYSLDRVDDQLIEFKDVFHGPDYAQKYGKMRAKLIALVGDLQKRLPPLQAEINQLRQGEKLTTDPAESAKTHKLAEKMQQAYNKQFQLTSDLLQMTQGMMEYSALSGYHPINGEDSETLAMPPDMKDLKSYLRFDGQRDVIRGAESDAGDIAYDIATTACK